MEIAEFLRRQFAYDEWANREAFDQLRASTRQDPRPLQLLAHILSAERLWLERIQQQPQSTAVWPDLTLEQCAAQMADLSSLWKAFLSQTSQERLGQKVPYTNSQGEPWTNTVEDILTHILLHSAYHRGQIASLVRAGGERPAYTDYIHAVRQGLIE